MNLGSYDINFVKMTLVLGLIQTFHKGGLKSFSEEEGKITALPGMKETVMVYHPNIPESLRQKLTEAEKTIHVKFMFIDDLNWEGMTAEEAARTVQDRLYPVLSDYNVDVYVDMSPLNINLMLSKNNPDLVAAIRRTLPKIKGFIRGSIIYDGKLEWVHKIPGETFNEACFDKPAVGESHVITKDDLTDLHIQLETDPWKLFE